jgi:hypothetical protein
MIRKILVWCGLLLLMAMLAVLALASTPAPAASAWRPVGNPDFTGTSPASESLFVYNGTPYLAYEGTDDKAAVMEYTGGSWQPVGGAPASKGMAASDSLFVYNGTPYVLYNDSKGGLTVMEYTGAAGWQPVGSPDFADELDDPFSVSSSLYNDNGQYVDNGWGQYLFVYDGIPYVAYQDRANGDKATVMEYTGSGASGWQPVGSPGFASNYTRSESLYVYNGTPYVAYDDFYNGYIPRFSFNVCKATVMEYTGTGATGWQPVGSPAFSSGMSSYDSLYVSNGTPYLAYRDCSNSDVATVMEYTGGSWQTVGGSSVDSTGTANDKILFDFPGTSLYVSNGTPYVAFTDLTTGKATVKEYTGGSWQPVGGAPASNSSPVCTESLYVDNGTPYVVYGGSGTTVMEYAGATTASSSEPAMQVTINGSPLQMNVPPTIVNGRTLAPARFVGEALGARVTWDGANRQVNIVTASP